MKKSKLKTRIECKFVSKGKELRNPHFQALVDWCEQENIDIEQYILNQGKTILGYSDLDNDWDYDILTKKGLEKILGNSFKKGYKEIKNIELCEKCIFKYQYILTGSCKNLFREKKGVS